MGTDAVRGTGVRGVAGEVVGLLAGVLALRWAVIVWEWTRFAAPRPASLLGYADALGEAKLLLTVRVWAGLVVAGLGVVATVMVAVWTVRAQRNAEAIAPGSQRVSRVWAVVGTLVPVVGLVLLPRVYADLWRAGDARAPRVVPVVLVWWAAWVASVVTYAVAVGTPPIRLEGRTIVTTPSLGLNTAAVVLQTVWLVAFAVVVLRVSLRQEAWRRTPVTV